MAISRCSYNLFLPTSVILIFTYIKLAGAGSGSAILPLRNLAFYL